MTIKSIMQEGNALHTGEVVGSIPTAPTIDINSLGLAIVNCAHVSPKKHPAAPIDVPCSSGESVWLKCHALPGIE
jgi:hypothetical protein